MARAARTYSLLEAWSTSARTRRATSAQRTRATAITSERADGLRSMARTRATTMIAGKVSTVSTRRTRRSFQKPRRMPARPAEADAEDHPEQHGGEREAERGARAVDEPREEIAPDGVGSERVRRGHRGVGAGLGGRDRAVAHQRPQQRVAVVALIDLRARERLVAVGAHDAGEERDLAVPEGHDRRGRGDDLGEDADQRQRAEQDEADEDAAALREAREEILSEVFTRCLCASSSPGRGGRRAGRSRDR